MNSPGAAYVNTAAGGSVATFTAVNRDTVGTAGGVTLTLTVSGISGTPTVTLNGVSCTSVVVVNSTTITCVIPALSVGGPYSMVCGGVTLGNCVTVLASRTTTIASTSFETGVIPSPFYSDHDANGSTTVTSAQAHSGTQSVLCQVTASGGQGGVSINQLLSVMQDKDFYYRHYFRIPAATLAATANNGQIKLYVSRPITGTTDLSWIMLGEGVEFNSTNNSFASRIDIGIVIIATTPPITADTWHEVQLWQRWDSGTGQGSSKVWYDGKLQGQATSANMGGPDGAISYFTRIGAVYSQNAASHPVQVYVDDLVVADGFIDP